MTLSEYETRTLAVIESALVRQDQVLARALRAFETPTRHAGHSDDAVNVSLGVVIGAFLLAMAGAIAGLLWLSAGAGAVALLALVFVVAGGPLADRATRTVSSAVRRISTVHRLGRPHLAD